MKKIDICFVRDRKQYGKSRKCWLPAFSPFPIIFSKGSFFRIVKSWDYVAELKQARLQFVWSFSQIIFSVFFFLAKNNLKVPNCFFFHKLFNGETNKIHVIKLSTHLWLQFMDLEHHINPFLKDKFQTLPNWQFADNFKFNENGRKFSKRV